MNKATSRLCRRSVERHMLTADLSNSIHVSCETQFRDSRVEPMTDDGG